MAIVHFKKGTRGYVVWISSCAFFLLFFYLVENDWLNAGSHNAPKEAV